MKILSGDRVTIYPRYGNVFSCYMSPAGIIIQVQFSDGDVVDVPLENLIKIGPIFYPKNSRQVIAISGYTANDYYTKFGFLPEDDDLNRINCQQVGEVGHHNCGWCSEHNHPVFMCGCQHYGVK